MYNHLCAPPKGAVQPFTYLAGCLENDYTAGETLDIGGPDVVNYRDLTRIYAEETGLPPCIVISVPVLTPYLSAKWIHLVTPSGPGFRRPAAGRRAGHPPRLSGRSHS